MRRLEWGAHVCMCVREGCFFAGEKRVAAALLDDLMGHGAQAALWSFVHGLLCCVRVLRGRSRIGYAVWVRRGDIGCVMIRGLEGGPIAH